LGEELKTENDDYLIFEGKSAEDLNVLDDSDEIQRESDLFVDFSSSDPFSEGNI
jgi:hypothetical protein